jgi:hypothetical protein
LPPALMMYSAIWFTRLTSECSRWRITAVDGLHVGGDRAGDGVLLWRFG